MGMTTLDIMKKYADDVLTKKIIASKHINFACERFFNDFNKSSIFFDEKAAEKNIKFCQLMCHVKGKWAGKPITFEPWQVFFNGNLFGWKNNETGFRRFSEGHLGIPRKNGKSLLSVSIGHYMLVADGENGAEILLAASKEEQAKKLFGVAIGMLDRNPSYRQFYGIDNTIQVIRQKKSGSSFTFCVGKPSDGGNESCGIVDEYHEAKSSAVYDAIKNGQAAREQPLLIVASTAGMDFKCAYKNYVEYCRKVVSGSVVDDTLFSLEYAVDEDSDWRDYNQWIYANPNYGISVRQEYLQAQYKKALNDAVSRSSLLTKHCNIWSNESSHWIDMRKWQQCGNSDLTLDDFEGEECFLACDLASRIDLTSLAIVFRREDRFYAFSKNYINEEQVNNGNNKHYQEWLDSGWLTVTEGAETDFNYIMEDVFKLDQRFRVNSLAYDPREATHLMQAIRTQVSFPCVEITQSPSNFSEVMKMLEAAYKTGKLIHNNNPILTWAASNVVLKSISSKVYYPAKENGDAKIDPIVALIMSIYQASVQPQEMNITLFSL